MQAPHWWPPHRRLARDAQQNMRQHRLACRSNQQPLAGMLQQPAAHHGMPADLIPALLLQGQAWDAVRKACVTPPTPLIQAAVMAKVVRWWMGGKLSPTRC